MIPARIKNADFELGKPADWDDEKDGHCSVLSVRLAEVGGKQCMVSAWQPSAEEIRALINGETVKLWIWGRGHPVVSLTVGDIE